MESNFVQIHVHTEHSPLDGAGRIEEMVLYAKSLGMNAIGITDHGTLSGIYDMQKQCLKHNMKPILGCEFYIVRTRDGENGHQLVIAKNEQGLSNMYELMLRSHRNFYKKPRITIEDLFELHEGLIVTSTCLASDFNQYLMHGEYNKAKQLASKYKEVFGDDFFMEIQPNKIPEQAIVNKYSVRIAEELGIKTVATNDVHYTLKSDCFPHEVLLAMQVKKKMSDKKRFKFSTNDFWLKSEEEMFESFQGTGVSDEEVKDAMRNTILIANSCDVQIKKGKYLPSFYDIPEGETERSLLVNKVKQGLTERGMTHDKEYIKSLQQEIDVIDGEGYSGYFLVVQDYVTSAKGRGEIVGDGRGSGAGSKVAYTTRITEIPPHEYDLLFERFMAKGREPDFDTDFSDQSAVFRDLQNKYGHDNVARIVAFGRMTPKAVIRKVFNTFGHDMGTISRITGLVPDLCKSLSDALSLSAELRDWQMKYPTEFGVIDRLQNVISHESQHAGGVLIYQGLSKVVPLKYDRQEKIHVVQWDKYMLEELGHFKFDILGLETLPIVRNTVESIYRDTGKKIDLSNIDKEDQNVYKMLQDGFVSGVFQLANQSTKVMQQKPKNFRDLIGINAAIRPGTCDWDEYIARRNGKEYTYMKERTWLEETQGLMMYQEQYLLDGHHLAGWDIAYADKHLRKNKNIKEDSELRDKFIRDCVARGYDTESIVGVWNEIVQAVSGGYSFNKSHAASYAMLSYQTAWLKHYYPIHFYSAMMSQTKTDGDGQKEISKYIAECKMNGITVLPPDINVSTEDFVPTKHGVTYRLTMIKNVGENAVQHIKELRPIKDFNDFLTRRNTSIMKKNLIVNLIKAGAFDSFNNLREELLWEFDMYNRKKTQIKNNFKCPKYEVNDKTYMQWEKEVLGLYISKHPMDQYGFKPLTEYDNESDALQGGEVIEISTRAQKNGKLMAFITLDTLYGTLRVLVFAGSWERKDTQDLFEKGNIVLIRGRRSGDAIIFQSGEKL